MARNAAHLWPAGRAPAPAWTKTIRGNAYTIKRIQGDTFGIWRDVEALGTFEVCGGVGDELRASGVETLSIEARAVVDEFVATYFDDLEGPAKRE